MNTSNKKKNGGIDVSEESRSLAEYLKCSHVGEENAIKARELTNNSWGSARKIRALVHSARMSGYSICSSDNGYFYASSITEVNNCIHRLRNTAYEIFKAIYKLEHSNNII